MSKLRTMMLPSGEKWRADTPVPEAVYWGHVNALYRHIHDGMGIDIAFDGSRDATALGTAFPGYGRPEGMGEAADNIHVDGGRKENGRYFTVGDMCRVTQTTFHELRHVQQYRAVRSGAIENWPNGDYIRDGLLSYQMSIAQYNANYWSNPIEIDADKYGAIQGCNFMMRQFGPDIEGVYFDSVIEPKNMREGLAAGSLAQRVFDPYRMRERPKVSSYLTPGLTHRMSTMADVAQAYDRAMDISRTAPYAWSQQGRDEMSLYVSGLVDPKGNPAGDSYRQDLAQRLGLTMSLDAPTMLPDGRTMRRIHYGVQTGATNQDMLHRQAAIGTIVGGKDHRSYEGNATALYFGGKGLDAYRGALFRSGELPSYMAGYSFSDKVILGRPSTLPRVQAAASVDRSKDPRVADMMDRVETFESDVEREV